MESFNERYARIKAELDQLEEDVTGALRGVRDITMSAAIAYATSELLKKSIPRIDVKSIKHLWCHPDDHKGTIAVNLSYRAGNIAYGDTFIYAMDADQAAHVKQVSDMQTKLINASHELH